MSDYPINSTARKFYNIDGDEVTLHQLIKQEPAWARNRIMTLEQENRKLRGLAKRAVIEMEAAAGSEFMGDDYFEIINEFKAIAQNKEL